MRTVKFLEELGCNPEISNDRYLGAIDELSVSPAERESLRGRDAGTLAALLGGRAQMWCAVMTPNHKPEKDRPEEEPEQDEPMPEPDDE